MAENEQRDTARNTEDIEERTEHIARALKDCLREGDAFLVRCQDEEIIVVDAPQTRFQQAHPRLYGRLLSVNEQLDAGCGLTLTLVAAAGILCLGLHAGWWDQILPPNVTPHLQTWWFYGPFLAVCGMIGMWLNNRYARRAYRRSRAELLAVMRAEGFDRDTLIPQIKGISEFENIVIQLKRDPGPFVEE